MTSHHWTRRMISGVALAAVLGATTAAQATEITIAGFGGKVQSDLAATIWEPAAAAAGVTLRQESHDGLAALRLQVKSGAPTYDIFHLGANQCARAAAEGLFEPLDPAVVDATDLPERMHANNWVAINSASTVLAWRTDKYGDHPPQSWADFWDVEAFPGRRAMSQSAGETFEHALAADGVPLAEIYPIDIDRAVAKLEEIAPDVVAWWTSGAQSTQLLVDGEVDMISIWTSRAIAAQEAGAPVAFTYNQGVLGFGCVGIVKGSAHKAEAEKLIGAMLLPEIQARIPEMMGYYGPVNPRAFDTGLIPAGLAETSNTSPANTALQVAIDPIWWAEHEVDAQEAFSVVKGQ